MTPSSADDVARERVRAWVHDDVAPPPWPDAGDAAARLGWLLKDACYATWNTEPPRARRAAALLHELAEARQAQAPVLRALACWTRGIAELGAGRMGDAIDALDAAAAGFTALGDEMHAAQTQVPKLMALSVLGRHDEAVQCAQATLARFVASGDERSAGKIELNLGTMLFRQDRHADACRHYRSAAQRFAAVGDVEQSVLADIGLANALTWLFDFDEALRVSERARQLADAHGYTVLSAQARGSIGQLELNRGQPQRALPALAEACRLLEQAGGLPQRLAEAEISLADAYLALNLLPEAVARYDRVTARCAEHEMPIEHARATLQRAQALARLGALDRAQTDLEAARQLFDAQGNAASAALAALQLAALALQRGDAAQALAGALAVAPVFDAHTLPGWRCEAEVLAAEACAAAGDATQARQRFEAALALPGAASHTDWRCRLGLAALDSAAGRRDAARAQLEQALEVIEAQRAALPADEFRTAFGADKASAYDALVELAWQALADAPADAQASAALWQALERARGRALAIGLARADPGVDPGADALRTRLQWTREQARHALAEGDAQALASLGRQAQALEQQLLEAWRLAQATAPAAAAGAEADALPPLAALQSALEAGDAWVQYHRLGARWIAAVVRRDAVRWCDGDASGIDERLEALRFQLEAMRGAPPRMQAHAAQLLERTRRHLQALHRQLWAPLADALGASTRVFVVPHASLHYVPFAALHDGRQWLVERHELVLAPSATAWMAARRRPPSRCERLLALGVDGGALPHVEAEVRAIARYFGPGATLRLGAEATRSALREAAPSADVVHLACHAQFRADSPYFSALHLADGEMTLRDAAALPLNASLVTLSACETGLSRVAPGDELVGLVRGFLLAGAPNVVATLWTVDDASTAALMQEFYAGLCAGRRPAAALRDAQSARAAAGQHPFYWAAFALHGRD
ncbi:CHAT domain-containing tetratricopeptide repeat protein [Azohydromonas sediminis]|uniref:CHAT domain-containing tetratricopeptide repeat protein n=1 Tax=Azohydromonas sediminis TaxID=2259674 RepID=UPI000E6542A6|nr:CHAT domain-containing protein [Azohydromonas sediminis]